MTRALDQVEIIDIRGLSVDLSAQESPFYRLSEVARVLQVSKKTIYTWIDAGRLQGVILPSGSWRFPKVWIANNPMLQKDDRRGRRPKRVWPYAART